MCFDYFIALLPDLSPFICKHKNKFKIKEQYSKQTNSDDYNYFFCFCFTFKQCLCCCYFADTQRVNLAQLTNQMKEHTLGNREKDFELIF